MKKTISTIFLVSLASFASAHSETRTFTATDESRVKACTKAKEEAQQWVRIQMAPPYVVSQGTVWRPTSTKYSTCDCGKSDQKEKVDCSVDAMLSN